MFITHTLQRWEKIINLRTQKMDHCPCPQRKICLTCCSKLLKTGIFLRKHQIVTIDNGERYGTVPESFVSKIICNRITWPMCFNLALRNHRYSFVIKIYFWRKPKNNLTTYIKDTYILTRGLRERHKYQLIVIYVSDCKYHYSIDQYTIYIKL